jgi:hypothetical protein
MSPISTMRTTGGCVQMGLHGSRLLQAALVVVVVVVVARAAV